MTVDAPREPWHLDKRVPIALIAVLVAQTMGWVWWAASMDARTTSHSQSIARNVIRIQRAWDKMNVDGDKVTSTAERVAKMEGTLEHVSRQLDRVLDKLDKRK